MKDYKDFTENNISKSPESLDQSILKMVKQDLDPSGQIVFAKLLSVQGFIGLITLVFCPQFSLSLTNNHQLFHFFHHTFGPVICMVLCGSVFMGSGALFAAYLLKESEIKKLRSSKFLSYSALSLLSLSAFYLAGAEIYLKMALTWMIGSIVGGTLLLEINYQLKKKLFVS